MSNKISIYLVKEGFDNIDDIFKAGYSILRKYSTDKVLYSKPSKPRSPSWIRDFFHITEHNLLVASPQAVLLLRRTINGDARSFVVVFGHGLFMLNENVLEERFGLITLLNLVDEDQIKRINRTDVGGSKKISDEQLPTATNISEFGFQIDRDLLKKVYGKINNEHLGKCLVVGGALLSLNQETDVDNIEELVDYCYRTYLKQDYKQQFDWIDNISPIKDNNLVEELNTQLVQLINDRRNDRVMLSQPELINWEDIEGFKYSGQRSIIYDDIELDSFIDVYPTFDDITKIKNKRIHIISKDGRPDYKDWSAFRCLSAEIEYQDNNYCLSDTKWYVISRGFVESIEKMYKEIPLSELHLPDYNHKDENTYNKAIADASDELLSLDCNPVMYGGGRNKVEVCDILTKNKQLIHVKHNYSSGCISHLFNQATVSAELLKESDFRAVANQKIEEDAFEFNDQFRADEYSVIIAIIDKNNGDLPHIPFFSKVSIRYAAQRIRAFGYRAEIMKIRNIKTDEKQQEELGE